MPGIQVSAQSELKIQLWGAGGRGGVLFHIQNIFVCTKLTQISR